VGRRVKSEENEPRERYAGRLRGREEREKGDVRSRDV